MTDGVCMVHGYPLDPVEGGLIKYPRSQIQTTMDPRVYLDITGWSERHKKTFKTDRACFHKPSLDYLLARIKNNQPLGPLHVTYDIQNGFDIEWIHGRAWLPDHDGRHRALACLKSSACTRVPVIITVAYRGRPVPVDPAERERYGESLEGRNMIPLDRVQIP